MAKIVPVSVFDCVVFGATGDLHAAQAAAGAVSAVPRRTDARRLSRLRRRSQQAVGRGISRSGT